MCRGADAAHPAHLRGGWKHARTGAIEWHTQGVPQNPFILRAIYFVLIGWWLSLLWSNLAWFLCLTIVGLPVGIPMFNYLPAVTTLMRN